MASDDEPAKSGYEVNTFFVRYFGGVVVTRYAVIADDGGVIGEMRVAAMLRGVMSQDESVTVSLPAIIAEGL